MPKGVRVSLANKCQLLFGLAVVLILTAALSVGAVRMQTLVHEGQRDAARKIADAWLAQMLQPDAPPTPRHSSEAGIVISVLPAGEFETAVQQDTFLNQAIRQFKKKPPSDEVFRLIHTEGDEEYYRYARAVRQSHFNPANRENAQSGGGRETTSSSAALDAAGVPDPLQAVLLVRFGAQLAQQQLLLNRVYLVAAGLFAGLLAIATFWFITTRIILSPVRVLRDTAAKVSTGDLRIRSDINTGDEFEQLSDAFNTMLENLKNNQDQLQSVNKSLDLKLVELAQTNVSLYEANKVKGEFLANVSHELRTPLNSIIGFAEVLGESLKNRDDPADEKRLRYVNNIATSSRHLMDLINDLLDLAKIEAGRMDLRISRLNIADTAEGLINLMRPQAEKNSIELKVKLEPAIPLVETDPGKVQQILFNFLSNAIKFTPPGGTVTLSARLIPSEPADGQDQSSKKLCVSVIDTGPGIAPDKHELIFEKFTQIDPTVTRAHSGTGLGLTISRELAALLQGKITLDSDIGQGATFSLIIPLQLRSESTPLMPDDLATASP